MTGTSGVVGSVAALGEVRARIEVAAREAGRVAGDVTLVAVSKTFEADAIRPVLLAGQRVFGENRVQEAKGKWPALARGVSRCGVASDRAAAVEQGGGGGGVV